MIDMITRKLWSEEKKVRSLVNSMMNSISRSCWRKIDIEKGQTMSYGSPKPLFFSTDLSPWKHVTEYRRWGFVATWQRSELRWLRHLPCRFVRLVHSVSCAARQEEPQQPLSSRLLCCHFLLCPPLARYAFKPRMVFSSGTPHHIASFLFCMYCFLLCFDADLRNLWTYAVKYFTLSII